MRTRTCILCLSVVLALVSSTRAEEAPKRRIRGSFGGTLTSEYFAQGLVVEKKGVIFQPYGRIALALHESFEIFGAYYLSIHDAHTDAGLVNPPDTPKRRRAFYEADWFAGAVFKHGRWSLSSAYWEMLSPNDGFVTARAVETILTFADQDFWVEGAAFDPHAIVFVETDEKSGSGVDEGWYLQLGLKPNTTIESLGHPLNVSLPTAVGFGFHDFYAGDESWGYASTGIAVTAPLAPYVPETLGAWSLTPSFAYARCNEDVQYLAAGPNRTIWSLTLHVDF